MCVDVCRPLFRGCSDPYHGVRSLSCSCLALLLTLQPLAQWINDTDTQRRTDTTQVDTHRHTQHRHRLGFCPVSRRKLCVWCVMCVVQLLCLVVDLASGDPTSGVKAAAVRVLGLVLGQDKGLEAVAQLGLVTKACNAMVTAAHDDKVPHFTRHKHRHNHLTHPCPRCLVSCVGIYMSMCLCVCRWRCVLRGCGLWATCRVPPPHQTAQTHQGCGCLIVWRRMCWCPWLRQP